MAILPVLPTFSVLSAVDVQSVPEAYFCTWVHSDYVDSSVSLK